MGERLSFAGLNQKANQLAHHLIGEGVGPETPVAALLPRSIDTVVTLLAILKAGGVYLPLDPAYPREHLQRILRQSQARVVVTEQALLGLLPGQDAAIICLDRDRDEISSQSLANPESRMRAENLTHIVYTTGSTGEPKGVAVPQRQLLNRCAWTWRDYPFEDGEVLCQRTTVNFSVSLWEMLGGLLQGVTTLIVPDEVAKDPPRLIESLWANGATRIVVVPSLLRAILETGVDLGRRLPELRLWSVCGEALPAELSERFHARAPGAELLNQYGASEVNDVACHRTLAEERKGWGVAVGRPILNTRIHVLDGEMRPSPVAVVGEVYVGGPGLARGYLNDPGLTAERFVPDPMSVEGGARLYRMGDQARVRGDGELEYVGRSDDQVKVRGMRVEMRGVEATLREHPVVREAVVAARAGGDGEERLIGYVTLKEGAEVSAAELRKYLRGRLPEYQAPAVIVRLEEMPRTANGKVNRRALPTPDQASEEEERRSEGPRGPVEEVLVGIWRDVLGVERVGVQDNFFDLGGHSLLATKLIARVVKIFRIDLPLGKLFERPTVAEMAKALIEREEKTGQTETIARALKKIKSMSSDEMEQIIQKKRGKGVNP